MLKALYDYAVWHELTLPPGCVNKTIKVYIDLDSQTDYLEIYRNDDTPISCPDIGSLANGTEKSNVLVEKCSVVIPEKATTKSRFFLDALRSAAEQEPLLLRCVQVLEDPEKAEHIRAMLAQEKVKPADRISFRVDGRPIVKMPAVMAWWQEYRKQFAGKADKPTALCLITGKPTAPLGTTAKIQGLHAVGGHASGDALICFDKAAFCSYGLKQAANAPVSEEAYGAVKAALDVLIADAPVLAGMKFVHWFDRELPMELEEEVISDIFGTYDLGTDGSDDEERSPEESAREERAQQKKADAVVEYAKDDKQALPDLSSVRYYILMLSGVNGRIMIRRYERGNYQELREHLALWKDDLRLVDPFGTGDLPGCKLIGRMMRLLSYQKVDTRPFERLSKELSGITPAILSAVVNGTPLPDGVAVRALSNIRSRILGTDNEDGNPMPDPRACQWLKVWLKRKKRLLGQEDALMDKYNWAHPVAAYHCGGIMAVYSAIQGAAMDVKAGVIQRYYASAVQSPALVISQLSKLGQYHLNILSKKNRYLAREYAEYLQNLHVAIGDRVPTTLNLEEQSYFSLGYYQMWALLNREKAERIAAKKQKEADAAMTDEEDEDDVD